jgi:hypothetical protein
MVRSKRQIMRATMSLSSAYARLEVDQHWRTEEGFVELTSCLGSYEGPSRTVGLQPADHWRSWTLQSTSQV